MGDKAFVGLDVLLYIVSSAWAFMLAPSRVDEAMVKMQGQPNSANVSREMIEAWTMGFTGGCLCISLIIYIFLWLNMLKGKKWAFIKRRKPDRTEPAPRTAAAPRSRWTYRRRPQQPGRS